MQHPASVQLPEPDAPSELSVAIEQMRARDRADDSDSGIYALTDAQEAFAARALLARAAQHSLERLARCRKQGQWQLSLKEGSPCAGRKLLSVSHAAFLFYPHDTLRSIKHYYPQCTDSETEAQKGSPS